MVCTSASVGLSPCGPIFTRMSEQEESGFSMEEMTDVNLGRIFYVSMSKFYFTLSVYVSLVGGSVR